MDIPPNQTLYVNNLPEKIKKEGGFKMLLTYHKRGTAPFSGALFSVRASCVLSHPCEWLIEHRAACQEVFEARLCLERLLLSCRLLPRPAPLLSCRAATAALRPVWAVWQDHRCGGDAHRQAAWPGGCARFLPRSRYRWSMDDARHAVPINMTLTEFPCLLLYRLGWCLQTLQLPPMHCAACRASPSMTSQL